MNNVFRIVSFLIFCNSTLALYAQEDLSKLFDDMDVQANRGPVIATFKSPRLVNAQTIETPHKHDLLFLVIHRFGDIAGNFGGFQTFYGLDNSTDILIGFDYGITDRWSIGTGRTKGAPNGTSTSQKQLIYVNSKYRMIQQTGDDRTPVSVSLFGNTVVSAMNKLGQVTSDANFSSFSNRLSFIAQAIIARKFSDNLSLELLPTFIRRNYVTYMDQNNLLALGVGGRMKVSPRMAIIADYYYSFRKQASKDYFLQQKNFKFYNSLSLGLEIETGGHVFNVCFTNATATLENQYIPSTSTSWGKGEFRWGFSISRAFSLGKKTGETKNSWNKQPSQ
ncbi:MAG TPA: DUF5777 family beta-barrel protein [Sunxiuqinia sp.]|nr:DUF5777 family beta-barrel protein [Sunxiuqinia sp.]